MEVEQEKKRLTEEIVQLQKQMQDTLLQMSQLNIVATQTNLEIAKRQGALEILEKMSRVK